MKKYLLYHLRWQSGFVICTPLLYLFIDNWHWPIWVSTIVMQFVGGCIYWYADKFIFRK